MDKSLEGWHTDPYARHEARWMSDGTPTALVRDGAVEGHDPAPEGPFIVTPERLGDDPQPNGGADLRRADEAERSAISGFERDRRAWDAFDRSGGSGD
jgi:hypothetical protein